MRLYDIKADVVNDDHICLFCMDNIVWRKIEGYDHYDVSSGGHIRNGKTGRILKYCLRNGYPSITLSLNNRKTTVNIHSIVAQTFLKNRYLQIHMLLII